MTASKSKASLRDWNLTTTVRNSNGMSIPISSCEYAPSLHAAQLLFQQKLKAKGWTVPLTSITEK